MPFASLDPDTPRSHRSAIRDVTIALVVALALTLSSVLTLRSIEGTSAAAASSHHGSTTAPRHPAAPQQVPGARPAAPSTPASVPPAQHARPAQPSQPPSKGRSVNCRKKKCIALTFDDGPGPYTSRLLTELGTAHVPATFFVIGKNVAARSNVVRRMVREGHVVGNHTWSHPQLTTLKAASIDRQIRRTDRALVRAGVPRPHLLRPPYGAVDKRVSRELKKYQMAAIVWNVDTEDWKNHSVGTTTARALAGAGRGNIILMHDIHPTTVKAVPRIIKELRKRGFTLVTVPELLGSTKPGKVYFDR